jgi:hypothetical protein
MCTASRSLSGAFGHDADLNHLLDGKPGDNGDGFSKHAV